ncbi:hypothetical protein [Sphingomonas sp. 3-13AW]|uniref:hypothetical protein n=1 Tax=Sphingomonas sp. 3-13AW TaxID=3050450 RepID=UPI003BB80E0E
MYSDGPVFLFRVPRKQDPLMSQSLESMWLFAMRQAARISLEFAANDLGDPAAAHLWREHAYTLSLQPQTLTAMLVFSRPEAQGELPGAGEGALAFDYLPYVLASANRRNSLIDASVRRAVLRQIRGRQRDAEIARVSPGSVNPPWACTVDVLTWSVLSHFLPEAEVAAFVSETPAASEDADALRRASVSRTWQAQGPEAPTLFYCHLTPGAGDVATDGLEFRLGGEGSHRVRIESAPHHDRVFVAIRGLSLPETMMARAMGRPLSTLLQDPVLRPAAEHLTIQDVSNHVHAGEALLSITCNKVVIRCAPAPAGATFAWESLHDPAAPIEKSTPVLAFGCLP